MPPPVFDARGHAFAPHTPRRIVSLVPSWTETLAALDLDDRVVGVTRFCVHPSEWHRGPGAKARVGGTKTVDVETVRRLAPDLVVANREENVREQVEALEAFAPVFLTDAATVDDALRELRALGVATGTADAADRLVERIADGLADIKRPARPPRVAYFIWKDPWMAAGGDTFIADVLRRTGFANVFDDRLRYPEVTPADVAAARPDALLFASEPFRFREKHVGAMRAACPHAAVAFVDGEAFSWYGAHLLRTPAEAARLHRLLASG